MALGRQKRQNATTAGINGFRFILARNNLNAPNVGSFLNHSRHNGGMNGSAAKLGREVTCKTTEQERSSQ
jgi:hypothetical protein